MKIDISKLNLHTLHESIKALFDDKSRLAIADEVLQMARSNYAGVGGIKGDGMDSPEELVASTKMWRIIRKNNKIIGGILYNDRGGKKVVPIDDYAYNRVLSGQAHPKWMLGNVQQFNKGTYKLR